jgi:drug/metabolite transporter (DMT)-like permease
VATTLNSTSPLFVLPLAALWMKERITVNAVVGAVIAVSGVALYFLTLGPPG